MNVSEGRNQFPGLKDKTFLDAACMSIIPKSSKEKIERFLEMAMCGPDDNASSFHIFLDNLKHECLTNCAKLLNVSVKNVSLIESTTHGLNIACNAVNFADGDEVIICDTEYLQVAIPFIKKQDEGKIKVIELKSNKNGLIKLENFNKLINGNTKAICVSAVQWCTGQRIFTKELGEMCKGKGIWLIVDGVHELGALDVDLSDRYCDFYVSGGHKWLNSPYGCGVMYMSNRALTLKPQYYGYLNLPEPEDGWGAYFQDPQQTPFRTYNFLPEAKNFGIGGTSNYPGSIGLNEAIKLIFAIGKKNIEAHVLYLSHLLKNELKKIGVFVVDMPQEECSGITIFSIFNDYEKDKKALDYLLSKKIFLSIRYTNGHGGFRASTHYFNNEEDVLVLVNEIGRLKNKK